MQTVIERGTLLDEHLESGRLAVHDDAHMWRLVAKEAKEALRMRHAFRDYLEAFGDPNSDFDAAEAVYGELVGNCARHAPGEIHVEFRWEDMSLAIVDACDRLRHWPFSPDDTAAEATHHAYAIVRALSLHLHVNRDANGTRASVVLPVARATR